MITNRILFWEIEKSKSRKTRTEPNNNRMSTYPHMSSHPSSALYGLYTGFVVIIYWVETGWITKTVNRCKLKIESRRKTSRRIKENHILSPSSMFVLLNNVRVFFMVMCTHPKEQDDYKLVKKSLDYYYSEQNKKSLG